MKGKKLLLLLSDHLFECFCVNTSKLKQIASKHAKKCIKCNLIKRHILHCWEPAREIPPMTKSCGRELLSKASELKGLPRLSGASTPKPESVCFTISWLSPTPLTLTGGYPRPPFSRESQLRAIANKSPGHERNISNQTPSVSILACLAGISRLLQLHIWLFTVSQLWGAREA